MDPFLPHRQKWGEVEACPGKERGWEAGRESGSPLGV